MEKYLADAHVHSKTYSWDSKLPIDTIVKQAEEKKLKYVVLTDHVELGWQWIEEVLHRLEDRDKEIDKLQAKTKVKIVKGIEVSEPHLWIDELKIIRDRIKLDCIYGSIHNLLGLPLKKVANNDHIEELYARNLLEMVESTDETSLDVISHLDYIKKYNMQKNISDEMLIKILTAIIENNLALEVNTHTRDMDDQYPSKHILDIYKELGGKKITIGSDSHEKGEFYKGIPEASELAENYGFTKGLVLNKSFRKI